MASTPITTFQDATQQLLMMVNSKAPSGLEKARARMAVLDAYNDVCHAHSWNIYKKRYLRSVNASYATGTVVYDHTGGTYERMLTLTTGTWPTWAADARISFNSNHYQVQTRESSSIITLAPDSNPGADVASTTYTIYQASYPLPVDCRRVLEVVDVSRKVGLYLVGTPDFHYVDAALYTTPSTPLRATIIPDSDYYGSLSITFSPPPSAAKTYDILYERTPRPLSIEKYSTGTVTVSGSSTSLTSSGATFAENVVGCIIRFPSSGTTEPTPVQGAFVVSGTTGTWTDNPYYAQRSIIARPSASTLTLDAAVSTGTLTGVGYTISDPLDIEPNAMLTAVMAQAEANYAQFLGRDDWKSRLAQAKQALDLAMEWDYRTPLATLHEQNYFNLVGDIDLTP